MFLKSLIFIISFKWLSAINENDTSLFFNKRTRHFSLFSAKLTSYQDVRYLKSLKKKNSIILFESLPQNKYLDFSEANKIPFLVNFTLKGNNREDLEKHAKGNNVVMKEVVEFVSDVLNDQVQDRDAFKYKSMWEHFRSLLDVYRWLEKMTAEYPDETFLESIGLSFEERDILAFSIKDKSDHYCKKIIMEGGSHGNEWISTAFVTYFIDHMLNSTSGTLHNLKRSFCWYFIPVLNPDGYTYSQTHNFLWRKNRMMPRDPSDGVGVDLNRNFDYNFGGFDSGSKNDFAGWSAFSEPESRVLSKYLERKSASLMYYFSIHGFGQKFLVPFSDSDVPEGNYQEVRSKAMIAARKIFKLTNRKYHVGTAWETLGIKWCGDSASWVKQKLKVPYVLTVLLRDDGTYGNLLPKEQIIPACQEMKEGLIEFMIADPRKLVGNPFSFSEDNACCREDNFVLILVFICFVFMNKS